MALVTATTGGVLRSHGGPEIPERHFLVPVDEYRARDGAFVVDPERHAELDEYQAEIVQIHSDLDEENARAETFRSQGDPSRTHKSEERIAAYTAQLAGVESRRLDDEGS